MATFIIGTLVIGSFVLVGHKVYKDKKMAIVVAEIVVTVIAHANLLSQNKK